MGLNIGHRPVAKHLPGQHDQSTHGNWATGFHGTTMEGIEGILAEGWDLDVHRLGRVWGSGAYFAGNRDHAEYWSDLATRGFFDESRILEAEFPDDMQVFKVRYSGNVEHPATRTMIDTQDLSGLDMMAASRQPSPEQAMRRRKAVLNSLRRLDNPPEVIEVFEEAYQRWDNELASTVPTNPAEALLRVTSSEFHRHLQSVLSERGFHALEIDEVDENPQSPSWVRSGGDQLIVFDEDVLSRTKFRDATYDFLVKSRKWYIVVRRRSDRVAKHYPGQHDQSKHGNWARSVDTSYRGQHQPHLDGAPGHDLSQLVSEDIYTHPEWYFTMDAANRRTMAKLRAARGRPDMELYIYRAVPEGVTEINPGDWVTLDRDYAELHGEGSMGGWWDKDGEWKPNPYSIIRRKVRAGELRWPADSLAEFGWFPEGYIAKHYPGGHDHDQSKHGNRRGRKKGKTLGPDPHAQQNMFISQPRLTDAIEPPGPTAEAVELPMLDTAEQNFTQTYTAVGGIDADVDFMNDYVDAATTNPRTAVKAMADLRDYQYEIAAELKESVAFKARMQELRREHPALGMFDPTSYDIPEKVIEEFKALEQAESAWATDTQGEFRRRQLKQELLHSDTVMSRIAPTAVDGYIERGHALRAEVEAAVASGGSNRFEFEDEGGFYYRHHIKQAENAAAENDQAKYDYHMGQAKAQKYRLPFAHDTGPRMDAYKDWVRENHPEVADLVDKYDATIDGMADKRERAATIHERRVALADEPEAPGYVEVYEVPKDVIRTKSTSSGRYQGLDSYMNDAEVWTSKVRDLRSVGVDIPEKAAFTRRRGDVTVKLTGEQAMSLAENHGWSVQRDAASMLQLESSTRWYGDIRLAQEGGFETHLPLSPLGMGSVSLRQRQSVYDLGPIQPKFIPEHTSAELLADVWENMETSDTVLISKQSYNALLYEEGKRLQNSASRDHDKAEKLFKTFKAATVQQQSREAAVIEVLSNYREMGGDLKFLNSKRTLGVEQIDLAADAYPSDWIERSNDLGPMRVLTRKYSRGHYQHNDYHRSYGRHSKIFADTSGKLPSVALHELGHRMEHIIPTLAHAEHAFYKRRIEGGTRESLRTLTGNSSYSGEYAVADEWPVLYMGKQYGAPHFDYRMSGPNHNGLSSSGAFELFTTGYPIVTGREKLPENINYHKDHPDRGPINEEAWAEQEAFILGILAEG